MIGGGGFGREVLDVIDAINLDHATTGEAAYEVVAVLDDGEPDPATLAPYGVEVQPVAALDAMPADVGYVIGIGSPEVRRKLDERFAGRPSPVLVHPSATMGRAVEVGDGSVICAGVRLTNNIRLGRHVHVNLNATVGHDARLGDHVTVSPLVAVSGYVTLGDGVLVGSGATINPGATVGAGAVIGAGAAVLRNVDAGTTAVGVPAKAR